MPFEDLFDPFDAFDFGEGLPGVDQSFMDSPDLFPFFPTAQDLQLFPDALSFGVPGIDDQPLESFQPSPGVPLSFGVPGIDDRPLEQQFLFFGDQGPTIGTEGDLPRLSFFGDRGIPPLRTTPPSPSALRRILDAVGRGAEGALGAAGSRGGGGGFFFSAPPHPEVVGPLPPTPTGEAPTPIPFQPLPSEPPSEPQGLAQLSPDFFPETRSRLPGRLSLQDLIGR